MPYVYGDFVLAINVVMDYILLYLTAALAQVQLRPWRLGAGSLLGGLYALAVLIAPIPQLQMPLMKVLVSVVMVVVAFGWGRWWELLLRLACFYLLSFLTGGATLFILYFTRVPPGSVPWWSLPAAVTASLGIGYLGWNQLRQHRWQYNNSITVRIRFDRTWVQLTGLVDTGNHLWDPLSHNPVIIIERTAITDVLPPEVQALYQGDGLDLSRIAKLRDPVWARRCQIIPFSVLGREKGLLLGMRPDEVCFFLKNRWERSKPALVGVVDQTLCIQGGYYALIPPVLLEA